MNYEDLTKNQIDVVESVIDWIKGRKDSNTHECEDGYVVVSRSGDSCTLISKYLTIGGYAGTGKTTVVRFIKNIIENDDYLRNMKIAFVSFTGKAALVLKDKVIGDAPNYKHYFGTIHKLIYIPHKDPISDEIESWELTKNIQYDLIIIDEASMISQAIFNDLNSFGIPIIAIGDHGQLPPIDDKFNLMGKPTLILDKIHRQAEDNPIIKISRMVRDGYKIPEGRFSDKVFKYKWSEEKVKEFFFNKVDFMNKNVITLCGMNKTRKKLNDEIRKKHKYVYEIPYIGERIICLKNSEKGLMNGQLGEAMAASHSAKKDVYDITFAPDYEGMFENGYVKLQCYSKSFGVEKPVLYPITNDLKSLVSKHKLNLHYFDYGYCCTVHKSQGSSWEKVVLFDETENFYYGDYSYKIKWLYTGITRSSESLFIIS